MRKGTKVLFLAPQPFFQWRGSPIRVGFDVQALAELGAEVDLLTLPIGSDRAIPGVRVLRVANPFRVRNIPVGPSGHKAFFDLLILLKAIPLAMRRRYDVIHCVEETGVIGILLGLLTRARVVFEKHSDPASHKEGFLKNLVLAAYRRAEAISIRRASAVIGTGAGLVEQARNLAPNQPCHHIFDIPSSLVEADPAKTAETRRKLEHDPSELLVLYVGSFAVYQGVDLMFASMGPVVRRCPRARFIVIGGSEEEIAARRRVLAAEGIEASVSLLGHVPPDELPNYLAAADVLLSPRIAGVNTPLKLLDYLKSGRAIVAADSPANRLILKEAFAVLTRPDPDAFAEGICGLLADAETRARFGREGRRLIDELYNFAEFKRRLDVCYSALS
jgi:glycosyltransferase involved in cell wall biosynthesis